MMWSQKTATAGATLNAIVLNGMNNQQNRQMTTLKEVSSRLKSMKNLRKITQSMKIMSASRYSQAERDFKEARAFGESSKTFYEIDQIKSTKEHPKKLAIAMTSDRAVSQPSFAEKYVHVASDISQSSTTFTSASEIAKKILDADFDYSQGKAIYKKFKNVVLDESSKIPIFNVKALEFEENLAIYDSIDPNVMKDYLEYSLVSLVYYTMKENACAEQSKRMAAMDNATKNADEMIDDLLLTFNRTRQSASTNDLIGQ